MISWRGNDVNTIQQLAAKIFNIPEEFIYIYDIPINMSKQDKENWVEFLNLGRPNTQTYKFMTFAQKKGDPIDICCIMSKNLEEYIHLEAILMYSGAKISATKKFVYAVTKSIEDLNKEVASK